MSEVRRASRKDRASSPAAGTKAKASKSTTQALPEKSKEPKSKEDAYRRNLVTVALTSMWYLSSMLAITTSKMTMQAARVPLILCCVQFFSATCVSGILMPSRPVLPKKEKLVVGGIALTYTLGFFFTNLAFSMAEASFVETVKAGEPLSTVALAFVCLQEQERWQTYATLVPVVVGVGMASAGEAGGGTAAFLATIGSNWGFSGRAVLAKLLKKKHCDSPAARSDLCLFFHISWLGLLGLLPLAAIQEVGDFSTVVQRSDFEVQKFILVILTNGLMYTAYNLLSFMVLSRVATATHAVLNVCRRVCVITAATLVFGTPLTAANIVGISIAVFGMLLFGREKAIPPVLVKPL